MLGLENFLKTVRSKCLTCQRYLAIPLKQQMSALPSWRFQKPLRAFAQCGLDFAGPFELKAAGRGKAKPKTYLLLFTCLQTRAVHLELTEAMSMSSIIASSASKSISSSSSTLRSETLTGSLTILAK